MHAQCMDLPHNWTVVEGTLNGQTHEMVEEVIEAEPDVVMATCWLFNHEKVEAVLRRVHVLTPTTQILLGGPEFLGDNKEYLQHRPWVTAVVRGEGEAFIRPFLSQTPLATITGVCLYHNEEYVDNGMARVGEFAALTPPHNSHFFHLDKGFVQLETTRGCFNHCRYCVSGTDRPLRHLPIEEVETRLRFFSRQKGIKQIRLIDRTFNGTPRAIELLDLFERYPTLSYHVEVHPAFLSDRINERLATAPKGLLHLEAGVQSLQAEVITATARRGDIAQSLAGLTFLRTIHHPVHVDLIAGLPHYTLEALFLDARHLMLMEFEELQVELLKLLPGTPFRNEADRYHLKYSPLPPYEVLSSDAMTPSDLRTARILSRIIDLYFNKPYWRSLITLILKRNEQFLYRFATESACNWLQPLTPERCGGIIYDYCQTHHPDLTEEITLEWLWQGFTLLKHAGREAMRCEAPVHYDVIRGNIPTADADSKLIWYRTAHHALAYNVKQSHTHPALLCRLQQA